MRNLRIMVSGLALVAAPFGALAAAPTKMKGAELMGQARVKLATARTTALTARPGTVTDEELEKEKGGSGLRYSFDITSRGKAYEVGVDARTGAVLENAAEGSNPD